MNWAAYFADITLSTSALHRTRELSVIPTPVSINVGSPRAGSGLCITYVLEGPDPGQKGWVGARPGPHHGRAGGVDGWPRNLTLVKTFDQLFAELTDKAATRPVGSGTVVALDAGVHAIGKKIVEEAAEVWMAAEYQSDDETAEEISQLIYHLQVLMIARGLTTADVYRHL